MSRNRLMSRSFEALDRIPEGPDFQVRRYRGARSASLGHAILCRSTVTFRPDARDGSAAGLNGPTQPSGYFLRNLSGGMVTVISRGFGCTKFASEKMMP